jgi:hypothetical protein
MGEHALSGESGGGESNGGGSCRDLKKSHDIVTFKTRKSKTAILSQYLLFSKRRMLRRNKMDNRKARQQ